MEFRHHSENGSLHDALPVPLNIAREKIQFQRERDAKLNKKANRHIEHDDKLLWHLVRILV